MNGLLKLIRRFIRWYIINLNWNNFKANMMAGKNNLVKFSNQIYDFELKYLEIYMTWSKTLYWFPKTFYLWTRWYNFYIYNFNKNDKNRGRKDIWCAKSEVIFFNFECALHEIEGTRSKTFYWFPKTFHS